MIPRAAALSVRQVSLGVPQCRTIPRVPWGPGTTRPTRCPYVRGTGEERELCSTAASRRMQHHGHQILAVYAGHPHNLFPSGPVGVCSSYDGDYAYTRRNKFSGRDRDWHYSADVHGGALLPQACLAFVLDVFVRNHIFLGKVFLVAQSLGRLSGPVLYYVLILMLIVCRSVSCCGYYSTRSIVSSGR